MQKNKFFSFILLILILSVFLSGCITQSETLTEKNSNKLVVHFIDVGQGDSTFIQFPNGETSLIDAGTRRNGKKVYEYLKNLNIVKIDHLIATHPHEDHIGGLPEIINNFSIEKVYMPDKTANTLIFEDLLKAIKENNLKIRLPNPGERLIDEGELKFTILAPNRDDYSNTNDYSIVSKIDYGDSSFLITGDAERASELDMIEAKYDLNSNVLRVGHHGGSTSTSKEFLEKVSPDYSIISLGENNAYGHPHKETIERLNRIKTNIMRTDELGNIVFISDGKTLSIREKIKNENEKGNMENKNYYIGNKNTKVFHSNDCGLLPKEENQIFFNSKKEAIDSGYKKHKSCVK